jgi:glycosyltransferase involved in cell wall biosynthesis
LRITIVTGFFLPVPAVKGGATEKIWFGLARKFAAEGHAVTFISRRWPGAPDDETREGITHVRVAGFDHTRHLSINLVLDFLWGLRVFPKLPDGDAVICNTVALPVWLRRMKPSAGAVCVMIGRTPKGQVPFYGSVERIYVPSSSIAAQVVSRSAASRTRVTGYPIDWATQARAAAQAGSPVTIGYVGRLHPEKGIGVFLAALKRLKRSSTTVQWRVKIVGPASVSEGGGGEGWVDAIRRDSSAFFGSQIEWLAPEYDPERLAKLYGSMDVFCYPSLAEKGETFGVAVAEAMAARCAVVVSNLACFSDLVVDGETGLVFDHNSADSEQRLSNCMELLVSDGARRREIAGRGQQRAKRFDYPEVSRNILSDLAFLTGTGAKKPQ